VETLRVTEIFYSLQGESRTIGWPTVFIRLTGCPLRCVWCDTAYAFTGGTRRTLADILESVAAFRPRHVCVTGGEPLAQKGCLGLLEALVDAGYEVSLETSGALDIAPVSPRVVKVMDLKPPGSGEEAANRYENIQSLQPTDQVKFVIRDEVDYRWAREQVRQHGLAERCEVLFSPVAGERNPVELAENILRDRLQVRFQIQLHKFLWGDRAGV
jgi:7-carboxy-7-deazaguanine synthase